MNTNTLKSILATAVLAASSMAHAGTGPFGLNLGVTSCEDAAKRIGGAVTKSEGKRPAAEARDPGTLYPGASSVSITCDDGKLIAVWFTVAKGGMGNPAGREAYKTLASKYKRVAGGPIPELGDGEARFASDGTVVLLSSPHLSFEFDISYITQTEWDAHVKRQAQAARDKEKAKTSAL